MKNLIGIARIEFCDTPDKVKKFEKEIMEISFSFNMSVQEVMQTVEKLAIIMEHSSIKKFELFIETIKEISAMPFKKDYSLHSINNSVNPNDRKYKRKRKW